MFIHVTTYVTCDSAVIRRLFSKQVLVAVGVVFSVLLYRLGIAGVIYRAVSGIPGGPSIGDIVVSLTGAVIQLIAIIILNRLYEVLALILNNWGEWEWEGREREREGMK